MLLRDNLPEGFREKCLLLDVEIVPDQHGLSDFYLTCRQYNGMFIRVPVQKDYSQWQDMWTTSLNALIAMREHYKGLPVGAK